MANVGLHTFVREILVSLQWVPPGGPATKVCSIIFHCEDLFKGLPYPKPLENIHEWFLPAAQRLSLIVLFVGVVKSPIVFAFDFLTYLAFNTRF